MTEFDKKLMEKAQKLSRWDYRDIDVLMKIADTKEAKDNLHDIRCELHDSVYETL